MQSNIGLVCSTANPGLPFFPACILLTFQTLTPDPWSLSNLFTDYRPPPHILPFKRQDPNSPDL